MPAKGAVRKGKHMSSSERLIRAVVHGKPQHTLSEGSAASNQIASNNSCCSRKDKPRSQELKSGVSRRINRVIGQLNGIKNMVEEDRYCGDVLIQLAAVESAVKAVSREIMRDHLTSCVVDRVRQGDTEVIDEVMDLFKKFM